MWPRNGVVRRPWIVGLFILASVFLVTCAEVEVIDRTPAASMPDRPTSPPSEGEGEHNLAVLAVDFDQQLLTLRQSVELLVAVENTGTRTERNVTVRVQLSTPEDPKLLLTQDAPVLSIAPGEIQIVRFARLGEIPRHQTYRLEVAVDPVELESNLNDNRRVFDIQIHQE